MNDRDTIRVIAPIINSYFTPGGIDAEAALDLIGRVLKENQTANPVDKP